MALAGGTDVRARAAVVRRSGSCPGWVRPGGPFPGEEDGSRFDLAGAGWLLSYVDDPAVHHPSSARSTAHRRTQVVGSALLTACMRRPWRAVLGLAAPSPSEPGRVGPVAP